MVLGPPCGSFIFLNLGTSKRSELRPYGDESLPHVELGSLLLGSVVSNLNCFLVFRSHCSKAMLKGLDVDLIGHGARGLHHSRTASE